MLGCRGERQRAQRVGFTLIELLVVIAIIALLISILLPALGRARCAGKATKEASLGKQMLLGWTMYANVNKDALIPGYMAWTWAHYTGGRCTMFGADPGDLHKELEGDVSKSWPWRFASAVGSAPQELQVDKSTVSGFLARSTQPTSQNPASGNYQYDNVQTLQYAIAAHPTFGLNSVYVGGHYGCGAFPNASQNGDGGQTRAQGGRFYVQRISQVNRPEHLIVFGTARQKDVITTNRAACGYTGCTVPMAAGDVTVPGASHIYPPKVGFPLRAIGGAAPSAWIASDKWDPNLVSQSWGNLDGRNCGKIITALVDGHVENREIADLRDMTRWSNYARKVGTTPAADWNFEPGP